jgi:hypothetical protein
LIEVIRSSGDNDEKKIACFCFLSIFFMNSKRLCNEMLHVPQF